jgi:hypothetical protein
MNQEKKKIIVTGYYGNSSVMTSKFCSDIVKALETVISQSDTLIFNGSAWASCAPVFYKKKHEEQKVKFMLPITYPFPKQSIVAKSFVLMQRRSGINVIQIIDEIIKKASDVEVYSSFRARDNKILSEADHGVFFFLEQNGKLLTDNKYGGHLYRSLQKKNKKCYVFAIKPDGRIVTKSSVEKEASVAKRMAPTKSSTKLPTKSTITPTKSTITPTKSTTKRRKTIHDLFFTKKKI